MPQNDLVIRSAYLKTVDKLPDRLLAIGKVENNFESNTFVFYILEVNSPWASSAKVKKAIVSALENSFRDEKIVEQDFFEKKVQNINDGLDKISKTGENSWVGNLNAAVGFVSENEIYVTQTGNVSGYIFRDSKISSLAEANRGPAPLPSKTFSEIISGNLVGGDRIVFGNIDLYNHVSLDRLRRLTDDVSAKETNIELFRSLRKEKVKTVNCIFIEANSQIKESDKILNDIPEVLCLDEPTETFLRKAQKNIYPKIKTSAETTGKHLGVFAKKIHLETKKLYAKSKENWQTTYGPKVKKMLSKDNGMQISDPKIKTEDYRSMKIKTKTYSAAPASKFSLALASTVESLKHIFLLLSKKENRKYLYLILIVIFLSAGYLKIRANNVNRDQKQQETEVANAYDQAKEKYDKTKEDLALGKVTSTSGLEEALALANKAKESPQNREKALVLVKQIQTSIDELNKTTRIYNPSKIITFNSTVNKAILAGTEIYGIDLDGKIYMANINSDESRLVASIGKTNGEVVDMVFSESTNQIIIYTSLNKVLAYDLTSKTHSEVTIIDDTGKWEDAEAIAAFSTNFYLLDSDAGEVWKHTQKENGYGKGTAYVDTKKTSIRGAVDLAIDGNIYILLNDGILTKFSRGAADTEFSLKNIPDPGSKIEIPKKVYTDAATNYIYILDSKLNRILRFNKAGDFVNQYALEGQPIDDFIVNNRIQKLWLISKDNIYQIDL